MTSTAPQSQAPPVQVFESDPQLKGVSFLGALRSELIKLIALRTTWVLSLIALGMAGLVALMIGISTATFAEQGGPTFTTADLAQQSTSGSYFGLMLLGALGVISITSEFSSGSIRSSMTAVPRRNLLLAAKGTALTLWVAVVSTVVIVISHVLIALVNQDLPFASPFTHGEVAATYAASWTSLLLAALLGLGLGLLLRSSAGGIVILAVIMFVLPIVISILYGVTQGAQWVDFLARAEYMHLLSGFTGTYPDGEPPLLYGLGLLGWTAVPLALGWTAFSRRDS